MFVGLPLLLLLLLASTSNGQMHHPGRAAASSESSSCGITCHDEQLGPCNDGHYACPSGLTCHNNPLGLASTGQCLPKPAAGDSCTSDNPWLSECNNAEEVAFGYGTRWPSLCIDHVCVQGVPLGAACPPAAPLTTCIYGTCVDGVCVGLAEGESCSDSSSTCGEGLYCSPEAGYTCIKLKTEGEQCEAGGCSLPWDCSAQTGTCVRWGSGAVGEFCYSSSPHFCQPDLSCKPAPSTKECDEPTIGRAVVQQFTCQKKDYTPEGLECKTDPQVCGDISCMCINKTAKCEDRGPNCTAAMTAWLDCVAEAITGEDACAFSSGLPDPTGCIAEACYDSAVCIHTCIGVNTGFTNCQWMDTCTLTPSSPAPRDGPVALLLVLLTTLALLYNLAQPH
ncbi:hypothetical protein Pelo_12957 [Pelomyxa schiedti]|nr:hypothetical protein Pelo_12957 [Pelomyxa schiedti]